MATSSVWGWSKATFCEHWKRIVLIALVTVLLAAANAAFPLTWQILIDQAIGGSVDQVITVVFVVLFMVRVVPFVYSLKTRFLNRYEFSMRLQLFKHVLRLSVPFHKDRESTKVLLEANKGVSAATSLLRLFLQGDIIADIPVAVFAFWYIGSHSIVALLVLVIFLIAFWVLSYWLGQKIAKVEEEYNEIDNEVSAREREVVQQIETVKLYCAESQEERWFSASAEKVLELDNRKVAYHTWFQLMASLAHVLPFCIALLIFLPEVTKGTLTVGTLIALQIYATMAVGPVGYLASMHQEIKADAARLKPALQLLQQQPTVIESNNPVEMKPLRHEICLKNITFQYPGADKPVLCGVSLVVAAGEKVAVVGKTGSGKTTLARLLVRFYDPDHGLVTMDGTDLRQLSFDSLYRQISYVTQEVPIFSVRYGLPDCGNDHVMAACVNASADFAFQQKRGLETKVGELGEKLSGGERQRLALARIFLRHPSVLILDEATSALDQMTEREVQAAFDRLLQMNGGTTMVVIAHRITTVKNADRIFVMEQGRIEDSGTHEELLSRCNLYQELCRGMTE